MTYIAFIITKYNIIESEIILLDYRMTLVSFIKKVHLFSILVET